MALCSCPEDQLCERCFARELAVKSREARVAGQCWAERVARRPEFRDREQWPRDDRALVMAARKVEQLTPDPRLRIELANACLDGATAWWLRRPEQYRQR